MNISTKLLKAAAGSAGGAGLDVDEVFSCFLYEGNATNRSIQNGIDLSGEGGLVWIKQRDSGSYAHMLFDTERGAGVFIESNTTDANDTYSTSLSSFNSDGFSLGTQGFTNRNTNDFVSWTFRQAPKFFDVLTYSGTGSNQNISHNLGSVPGMILIKDTSASNAWTVYHRGVDSSAPEDYSLNLGSDSARDDATAYFNDTAPTDSVFTVGTTARTNNNGSTYVAYLFAHNNNDGEFGPDADQDIIKCGSFTKGDTGTSNFINVNLGFEVQWLLTKSTADENWDIYDVQRGMSLNHAKPIRPNLSSAEGNFASQYIYPTSTGFAYQDNNASTYVYMAIRRGPLAAPTDATKVFTPVLGDGSGTPSIKTTNHITDFGIAHNKTGGGTVVGTRLLGTKQLKTHTTGAEAANSYFNWDFQNGWHTWTGLNTNYINWNWKRAPSFFDVVAFSGNSTSGRTVSHNLGVAPELMIVKRRTGGGASWTTYVSDLGATKYLRVNNTNAVATSSGFWNNTAPTSSVFTVGNDADVNGSGEDYIAYLFATVAGVSKVGSYTGTNSSLTIDCGFSSGARFVLIKRTNSTGNWWLFDSVRGIVSGYDASLNLDNTNAEDSSVDWIDPHSSGFTLPPTAAGGGDNDVNISGAEYIFYAIA